MIYTAAFINAFHGHSIDSPFNPRITSALQDFRCNLFSGSKDSCSKFRSNGQKYDTEVHNVSCNSR